MKKTPQALAIVAKMAAAGHSDPEIAERLHVTARTIIRWRQEAGIKSRWTPPAAPHGSPGRYERGCRCRACRDAHNRRSRAHRRSWQASTAYAPNYGEPWNPHHDQVLAQLGARRGADALGRTYYAAHNRLTQLRKEH